MTIRNQRLSLLKQPISSTLNQHLIDYPTPSNLSYWWGFGSLAAFIGYVLPWGQMSFWGATVITSLASAIPVVGEYWGMGGTPTRL
ncbi:hypothetical protein KY289_015915 [Solanum tuberosum]|nr:hypothetical protein KY289_015915 [Solanum tuberosum]